MERDAFLDAVRERLGKLSPVELPTALPTTPASGDGRLFDRFAAELAAVGGEAREIRADRLAGAVASVAEGMRSAVIGDLPDGLGPAVTEGLVQGSCEILPPGRDAAEEADLGVTGAEFGVASTGSVLLASGAGRPRATSLLPPTHLVVLPADRLLPGFEELVAELPHLAAQTSQLVLVSGPSRTSDIEMTLVRGVHGPGRVVVLVVT